jgi:hypothetical protein
MCVGPEGTVWAAVSDMSDPEGQTLHLVSYRPGDPAPKDHGRVGIGNPNYTLFVDAKGKPLPHHHTVRKSKDGVYTPWVPMGICAAKGGSVYITTIAPFTLLKFSAERLAGGR